MVRLSEEIRWTLQRNVFSEKKTLNYMFESKLQKKYNEEQGLELFSSGFFAKIQVCILMIYIHADVFTDPWTRCISDTFY